MPLANNNALNYLFSVKPLLAALLMVALPASVVAAQSAAAYNKICTKAEKRYQKLYGKPSASEDVVIVKMYKYTFCPKSVTVKQGTTVRWVNVDKRTSHSVWFRKKGDNESDRLFPEEKVEMKFDLPPGDYPYLCGPHWQSEGMLGTVTVTGP
jgi:plastocyanin